MTDELLWTESDGWILMALYLAGKDQEAELHEIIAAADAINHAIPTTREMSCALTKLLQCGVICRNEGKYSIMPEHLPAIKKAHDGRGGLFASSDKGAKWLRKTRSTAQDSESVELTDAEMKTAYDRYTKGVRKK